MIFMMNYEMRSSTRRSRTARRGRARDGGLRVRAPLYQFFAISNGGRYTLLKCPEPRNRCKKYFRREPGGRAQGGQEDQIGG